MQYFHWCSQINFGIFKYYVTAGALNKVMQTDNEKKIQIKNLQK